MLNVLKDIVKSPFFAVLLGMIVIGFLVGYITGNFTKPQNQTAYAQQHTIQVEPVQSAHSKKITVKKGDTLWGIAETYFPNHPTGQVVQYLKKINQLQSDQINAGDSLRLP